ncbi:HDOD domain-containing protein [Rhodoferax sp. PAMC 29310]|uniref:HDOD domain-containing protein n=1 Tax=Rhodoferax sp. PAMC 29310 TaxID=2822760 RepID=UPI001B32C5F1|nr:HDOD domain-containing protein [Rhodoferax sp. PAMC 29310]
MSNAALGQVALGYQLIWNALRQVAGVQLFLAAEEGKRIDTPQLLQSIGEALSDQAPQLLLSPASPELLGELLTHAKATGPWIAVQDTHLLDASLIERLFQAHQRGVPLVWRGEPGTWPSTALAACFARPMVTLTPEEALTGLRASLRRHNGEAGGSARHLDSPVVPGYLYESVASRALVEHCLDEQDAWGVAGWPVEDVLHSYRNQQMQPGQRAIAAMVQAIHADDSVERIEQLLSEEPTLAYRFLRYANSAAVGLRTEIESLRHGLMVLGLSKLRSWLLTQLPRGTSDLNLQPPRTALVMRASLMEQLMDAGESENLRREVYLCGLMSQIDLMLGEPLVQALGRLPLSSRISSAILDQKGPYLPYLEVATALESPPGAETRTLCARHQMDLEGVNLALLRTLGHARLRPAKGLLLV